MSTIPEEHAILEQQFIQLIVYESIKRSTAVCFCVCIDSVLFAGVTNDYMNAVCIDLV